MKRFVLSIGTNCEPRRDHLHSCLLKLSSFSKIIKTAPLFENAPLLPPGATDSWYQFFLNTAVLIESSLSAQDLLAQCQKVERDLGRPATREKWAPRIIDIDLLFELSEQDSILPTQTGTLTVPHPAWKNRNFVLAPLLHLLPASQSALNILKLHRAQKMPLTTWIAILNATPDSFSEKQNAMDSKLSQLKSFLELNAAVIDIGAESTRPGAIPVSPREEWQRLEPLLSFWREHKNQHPFTQISIDTRHVETAIKCLDYGASILNDVSGLLSPKMCEVAENYSQVIVMHSLSVPADPTAVLNTAQSPTEAVLKWAEQKRDSLSPTLQKKCIFDPGIGFGKTPRQSLQILQDIEAFHELEVPLVVGHSRKSFMNLWSQEAYPDRDPETLGVSSLLFGKVEFLRVHNLVAHQKMAQSLLALGGPA